MRLSAVVLALALAACGQTSAPADAPEATPEAAQNPDADVLGAAPLDGQWSFNSDGATIGAGFGPPESEYAMVIACNDATREVTLISSHELSPDQDTQLRIITEARTVDFPARSFNEGLPSVTAGVQGADERLTALTAPQARIAVEVAGQANVLPWHDSIARTLAACAD